MNEKSELPPDRPLNPRRRAIVIGASSGIGAELVRQLAAQGVQVAALARREEELNALTAEVNSQFPSAVMAYPHDVSDFGAVASLFEEVVTALGGLDLIIFNAGVMPAVALDEFDFAKDRHMIEVNLLGGMAWLNEAARRFRQTGGGKMVGISSVAGDRGRVAGPAYGTSKAGLATFLEAYRNRLSRHGVQVTTIKPGFVETRMLAGAKTTFGVISPKEAAGKILRAVERGRQVVYVPGWWRWIMLIIQHIPSFIFRRLSI